MKKVSQTLPKVQQEILLEGLNILEVALKSLKTDNQDLNYKLFDILTLKAMLSKSNEVVINVPFEVYERFTGLNGVDFPEYL